jgi:hypothetical protein
VRIDPFGNPEPDLEGFFTEAYDAVVNRVDLVKSPANGSQGFLLMKSGQGDGLIAADTIRDLLKAAPKPNPQNGSTMATPKIFRYTRQGAVVSSVRPLTKGQLAAGIAKAKAKGADQVAVFDAQGNLVGTVDASAITAIAAAPQTEDQKAAAATAAQAATVSTNMAPPAPAAAAADQSAEGIAKAIQGATFKAQDSTSFAKSAGTVDERFAALVKSIDVRHSERLRNTVAISALRLMAGSSASSSQAVRAAKMLACDLAAGEQARQRSRR